jgi:protein-disulfide isomerase
VTAAADSTKKATAKITVNPPQITVFPKTATIRQGMSFRFVADVQPEQAVTWKGSGDCGTATPDGRFQALNAGICSITASAIGSNGSEMSAEAEITVLAGAVNTGLVSAAVLAQSINLPANNFALCYSDEAEEAINTDMNKGSGIFGVDGTPTNVLLNRETGAYKTVHGASPADTFESALAEVLTGSQLPALSADTISEILADAKYYGNPEASIVFIVYCDLLCPFCRGQYSDETVETIVANHPGEVTMVFKNYPFHPTASLGAKGLYCAGEIGGDDAYYSYLAQAIQADGFAD